MRYRRFSIILATLSVMFVSNLANALDDRRLFENADEMAISYEGHPKFWLFGREPRIFWLDRQNKVVYEARARREFFKSHFLPWYWHRHRSRPWRSAKIIGRLSLRSVSPTHFCVVPDGTVYVLDADAKQIYYSKKLQPFAQFATSTVTA
jgi:hypothetical protein